MMRQGQIMMDMMQQVMGFHVGGRPDGAVRPEGDGGSRVGGSAYISTPTHPTTWAAWHTFDAKIRRVSRA